MFEFHGFAVISCGDAAADEAEMILVLSRLERLLDGMGPNGEFFRIGRGVNGLQSLTVSGLRSSTQPDIARVFSWLAEHAPGSYGLLYVRDDQEPGAEFRVIRLASGRCEEMTDPFLSTAQRHISAESVEPESAPNLGFAAPFNARGTIGPWRGASAELRIAARVPLEQLWDSDGTLDAERIRPLAEGHIRSMLQTTPVRFVVASALSPLRWIALSECLEFWKSEVKPRLVKESERDGVHQGRWYVAYEWRLRSGESVVELDRHGDE